MVAVHGALPEQTYVYWIALIVKTALLKSMSIICVSDKLLQQPTSQPYLTDH